MNQHTAETPGPRCAIVTGGAGGIGASVAETLSGRGYAVVTVDLAEPATVQADLRDPDTYALIERAVAATGAVPHTLVNAAFSEVRGPLADLPESAFADTAAVTFDAAAGLTQRFVRRLDGRPGSIVNIASVHGYGTRSGYAPYAAAKAALLAFTRAAAVEYGPLGIRCNAVAPAFTKVERNHRVWSDPDALARLVRAYPLRRVAEAAEVASVVAFLASDEASFVNGVCLPVDGGMSCLLAEETALLG